MKFLSITILVLLLAPLLLVPFSASAYLGDCGDYSVGRLDCVNYNAAIPCTGYIDNFGDVHDQCYPHYCCAACEELWDLEDYCPLKVCCLISRISRWLFYIATGLAMIVIIWAGVMYMTAGGEGDRASKAKKLLLYGLVGALIVFASGYILGTIIGFLY